MDRVDIDIPLIPVSYQYRFKFYLATAYILDN